MELHSSFPIPLARAWIAEFGGYDIYKWFLALGQDCTPTEKSNQGVPVEFIFPFFLGAHEPVSLGRKKS